MFLPFELPFMPSFTFPFDVTFSRPEYLNNPLVWGFAGVVVLALGIALFKRLRPRSTRRARYQTRNYLFTRAEWRFARALQKAVGDDWLLMGKVRIADVLAVEHDPRLPRGEWLRAFSRISQKHVGYVLVDPESGRVACCIELDDATHGRRERIRRDAFVNAAFAQAGMPLLRIPTAKQYAVPVLQKKIRSAIRARPAKRGKAAKRLSA
ncbi:hypothetical protein GCM10022228_13330 [Halomonas cibimaris]|uniref:DUF2726 domain-containing protein n=1 Tax=Halomonas cibimaris TaxID=657012 RepID=A0ABP7LRG2_9GAMM